MKLVYDKGLNDLKRNVDNPKFYQTWCNMLMRCYSEAYQKRQPTYVGCTVCEEWLTFSKFKTWMENQDWEGKELDKDILKIGNKLYSPETCVFIDKSLNLFLLESNASRGQYPIGVYLHKSANKFVSRCKDNGNKIYLGLFDTPEEAHKVWKTKKLELAYLQASKQSDPRVAKAIIERYRF